MLLLGQNIVKEYRIQTVLDIKKIEIHDGDRIGLIGDNRTGKSTLLDIINGESDGIVDGKILSQMNLSQIILKSGGEKTRFAIASAFSKRASLLLADVIYEIKENQIFNIDKF